MTTLAFGFGSPADLAVIFVVALIVFGPKKLPEIGKQIGQAMRELRKVTDELSGVTQSVHNEVESIYKPVHSPPSLIVSSGSQTVDDAVKHQPLDQEPNPPMLPLPVPPSDVSHPTVEKGL